MFLHLLCWQSCSLPLAPPGKPLFLPGLKLKQLHGFDCFSLRWDAGEHFLQGEFSQPKVLPSTETEPMSRGGRKASWNPPGPGPQGELIHSRPASPPSRRGPWCKRLCGLLQASPCLCGHYYHYPPGPFRPQRGLWLLSHLSGWLCCSPQTGTARRGTPPECVCVSFLSLCLVCVCTSVYVCVLVYLVCVCVYTSVCMCVPECMSYPCVFLCVYVCTCVYVLSVCVFLCVFVYLCVCLVCVSVPLCACVFLGVCLVCVFPCVYVCACVYVLSLCVCVLALRASTLASSYFSNVRAVCLPL